MNTLRITMLALLALAGPAESAMGDMPLAERISIARFAKLEGVKVDFKEEGQLCRITIEMDPRNEIVRVDKATSVFLDLRDRNDSPVAGVELRSRFDFPEGTIVGPFDDSAHPSLLFEVSCRKELLEQSSIRIRTPMIMGQGAVDVLLGDLFDIGKRKQEPEPSASPGTKDKTEAGNEAAPRSR